MPCTKTSLIVLSGITTVCDETADLGAESIVSVTVTNRVLDRRRRSARTNTTVNTAHITANPPVNCHDGGFREPGQQPREIPLAVAKEGLRRAPHRTAAEKDDPQPNVPDRAAIGDLDRLYRIASHVRVGILRIISHTRIFLCLRTWDGGAVMTPEQGLPRVGDLGRDHDQEHDQRDVKQ